MTLFFSFLLIVSMHLLFRKHRSSNVQENTLRESEIAREMLKAQVEVQDTALRQIGYQLLNHIGQLLSVAQINLNMLEGTRQIDENRSYIVQANEMVSHSIKDIRVIGKYIGDDFLKNFKLGENLSSELIHIRKGGRMSTDLAISGEKYALGHEKEIILFRISQEIISNIIRNAQATKIFVRLHYDADQFVMHLSDDGVNFENTTRRVQYDLAGIERKAEVIGGHIMLWSVPGESTTIEVLLPVNNP